MTLIRTEHQHQTSKPPKVARDPKRNEVTVSWGAVTMKLTPDAALELGTALVDASRDTP